MAMCLMGLGDVARLRGEWREASHLYERALRRCEELDRRLDIATTSLRIGHAARLSDDPDRARRAYARTIAIYREAGYLPGLYSALVGVAHLVLDAGDVERAAETAAGIHAWAEVESVAEPEFRRSLDGLVSAVRERLDPARFAEVWRRGETLAFEDLLALADEITPRIELHRRKAVG